MTGTGRAIVAALSHRGAAKRSLAVIADQSGTLRLCAHRWGGIGMLGLSGDGREHRAGPVSGNESEARVLPAAMGPHHASKRLASAWIGMTSKSAASKRRNTTAISRATPTCAFACANLSTVAPDWTGLTPATSAPELGSTTPQPLCGWHACQLRCGALRNCADCAMLVSPGADVGERWAVPERRA